MHPLKALWRGHYMSFRLYTKTLPILGCRRTLAVRGGHAHRARSRIPDLTYVIVTVQ